MNSVAILSVFCILIVWAVESISSEQELCDLIENEDGLKAVIGCINEHLPPFVNKLLEECYEEGFNEPGSIDTFLKKSCQRDEYEDEQMAMNKCIHEEGEKAAEAAGFTEQEMDDASSRTRECLMALAGVNESSNEIEEAIEEIEEAVE